MLKLELLESRNLMSIRPVLVSPLNIPLSLNPSQGDSPSGLSVQAVRHVYGFDKLYSSYEEYNQNAGKGQTIAIIDAFNPDYNPYKDYTAFNAEYSLPNIGLQLMNQNGGSEIPFTKFEVGWGLESLLDVEWAHAIAPQAKIVLILTNDNSLVNMMAGVDTARRIPGVTSISMSWGAYESDPELYEESVYFYDSYMKSVDPNHQVGFFAASGDDGNVIYPSSIPTVISVGGTSLDVDGMGNRKNDIWEGGEIAWIGSGGGPSVIYEGRTTPDVSYDADPNTGFPVKFANIWWQVGGTSAGAPQWAALYALMRQHGVVSETEDPRDFIMNMSESNFYDIVQGENWFRRQAGPGYDQVTGLGSPKADMIVGVKDTNVNFVVSMYSTFLNRMPDPEGGAYFVNLLKNGKPLNEVTSLVTHSGEYLGTVVNQVYQDYLGRNVEESSKNAFVVAMQNGLSRESVVLAVSTSPEATFGKLSVLSNFVNQLYSREIGRGATLTEYNTFVYSGATRQQIAQNILGGNEHFGNLVVSHYNEFLGRNVDDASLNYWVGQLSRGMNDLDVMDYVFGSDEKFNSL